MVNKIYIGAMGALTVALLISLGYNIQPGDNYFCSDRNITYHCDSLSQYYGIENGKCINDVLPNKLCRTGWETIFEDKPPEEPKIIEEPLPKVGGSRKFLCDTKGCVEIK